MSARRLPGVRARRCLLGAFALGVLGGCSDETRSAPGPGPSDAGAEAGPGPVDPTAPLADDTAGVPCATDTDCPGGECAAVPSTDATPAGGYCTRVCVTNMECGSGARCTRGGNAEGRCLAVCSGQEDCRKGFLCAGASVGAITVRGACQPMLPPGMLGDDVAGNACARDEECMGGHCAGKTPLGQPYPGSYCTGRCYEDGQCGRSGVCLWPAGTLDPGHCLRGCTVDADCRDDGYRCRTLGDGVRLLHACHPGPAPLGDHTAGRPCADDSACAAPATCARELPGLVLDQGNSPAPDGYCTQGCSLDADCGAGAQCVAHGQLGGFCLASCSDAAPCRTGYACIAHLRDGDPAATVCTPAEDP